MKSAVIGISLLSACFGLFSCGYGSCVSTTSYPDPTGRYEAEITEHGVCGNSRHPVVLGVQIADREALFPKSRPVFGAKGLSDLKVTWKSEKELEVNLAFPGQVVERLFSMERTYQDIQIQYVLHPFTSKVGQ
jgi:hypothetical protein